MIVWLASYPRSGNTLVRIILRSCFGLQSLDSELEPCERERDAIVEAIGHREPGVDWSEFYANASPGSERYFVKTHSPPKDDQPCIYIVRDGRKATLSYYYHFKRFFPEENRSLLQLVLGHDHYGDWTSHYRMWDPKARPATLLLRYEALLNDADSEIARISEFLGLAMPELPWQNPFRSLQEHDPEFFRKGTADWEPDSLWSPPINRVFQLKHGSLMEELGYRALQEDDFVTGAAEAEESFLRDVLDLSLQAYQAKARSDDEASKRLVLINQLTREASRRQRLIDRLSQEADDRLRYWGASPLRGLMRSTTWQGRPKTEEF